MPTLPWRLSPSVVAMAICGAVSYDKVDTMTITMMSWWARWRLKSPASGLFIQQFIQAQIKENIKASRHWPLCGNSPVTGGFPAQGPVSRKMFPFDDVIMDFMNVPHTALGNYACLINRLILWKWGQPNVWNYALCRPVNIMFRIVSNNICII